jgi:hypothetical protein
MGICVDAFLVAAKLRLERRLFEVMMLSSLCVKIFVKHFLIGSMIEIGRTWFSVKSHDDFLGIRKMLDVFQSVGIFWSWRHLLMNSLRVVWPVDPTYLTCS